MPRTFNREPHLVNLPSKNDVKNYFFNHNNWTGFNDDKNFVAVDQKSFSACKNVYVNEEGILRSRPYIKVKDSEGGVNMAQVIDAWELGPVNVYKTEISGIYYLTFVNEDFNIYRQLQLDSYVENGQTIYNDKVQLIVKDRKIFIFQPTSFKYYDMDTNASPSSADSFIYIPITKIVTDGIESDLESPNEMTKSNITRYIFKNFTEIDFVNILGKNVTIKVNNIEFDIEFNKYTYECITVPKHILPQNAYANKWIMGSGNEGLPLVDVVNSGGYDITLLCTCDTYLGDANNNYVPTNEWNLYWSLDYVTYYKLKHIDNIISTPVLSKDGLMACVLRPAGVYVISLVKDSEYGVPTYSDWTLLNDLSSYIGTRYYSSTSISPGDNDCYNLTCQASLSVVDDQNYVVFTNYDTVTPQYETWYNWTYRTTRVILIHVDNGNVVSGTYGSYQLIYTLLPYEPFIIKWNDNYSKFFAFYSYISSTWTLRIVSMRSAGNYINMDVITTASNNYTFNKKDDFVCKDNIIYLSFRFFDTLQFSKISYYFDNTSPFFHSSYNSIFTSDGEVNYCRISTDCDETYCKFLIDGKLYIYDNNEFENYYLLTDTEYEETYNDVIPISYINNTIVIVYKDQIFVNSFENDKVYIDVFNDLEVNYESLIYPSHHCELENYYISNGNKLYISKLIDRNDFKWYFPKINTENLEYDITNLHPISDKEVAIFQKNNIRYVTWDNDLSSYRYYKSRTDIGLEEGGDVLTTFDGKYTIFNTQRGLVAMSYQEFIASTEQALSFITDSIYSHYIKYAVSPIKLCKFSYWLFVYRSDSNGGLMFDFRTNSWWPFEYTNNCSKFIVMDNLVYLISNKTIYSNLYDDTSIYQDYIFNQEPVAIDWFIKSQKLHLDAVNYYKNIISLTLNNTFNDDVDLDNDTRNKKKMRFTLKVKLFRTDIGEDHYGSIVQKGYFSSGDTEKVISYDIDCISTFVQRVNFGKVIEFQYEIYSNNEWYEKIPLSLANVSVKYKIGSQVR